MTNPTIEAAVTALLDSQGLTVMGRANAVLAAVTPLIEAAALERAAKVADDQAEYAGHSAGAFAAEHIAAGIRSLKEHP